MVRRLRFLTPVVAMVAVVVAALPVSADISGSSVSATTPSDVTADQTLDVTFSVDHQTPDADYLDYFDITLPAAWTINTVYPNAGNSSCNHDGLESSSGQTVIWQAASLNDACGPWSGPTDFTVNVTVTSCTGAPWNLPWNLSSDTFGAPPHDVSGTFSAVTCVGDGDEDEAEPVPGCDVLMYIPPGAVGATITATTPVYWAPGKVSDEVFPAGLTLRAIGVDESGEFYKVLFNCGYYWVPANVIGPNYDAVWNGAPLPTDVVD